MGGQFVGGLVGGWLELLRGRAHSLEAQCSGSSEAGCAAAQAAAAAAASAASAADLQGNE